MLERESGAAIRDDHASFYCLDMLIILYKRTVFLPVDSGGLAAGITKRTESRPIDKEF